MDRGCDVYVRIFSGRVLFCILVDHNVTRRDAKEVEDCYGRAFGMIFGKRGGDFILSIRETRVPC